MGRTLSTLIFLGVLVYAGVVASGAYLKNDPTAYLPIDAPGNQLLRDWYTRLGPMLAPPAQAQQPSTPAASATGGNCPPPIAAQMSGSRIPLDLALVGPAGSVSGFRAILDTGAGITAFPYSVLRGLGLRPIGTDRLGGVVPGSTVGVFEYQIDGKQIQINDNGRYVPIASGPLTIVGIPDLGTESLVGPDVLKAGLSLQTNGAAVTLTPPC